MEKETLKTLHEKDLEQYLQKLGVLEIVQSGAAKCKFCHDIIRVGNIHVLFPESGQVKFVCDKPQCIKELNNYLRQKKYAER